MSGNQQDRTEIPRDRIRDSEMRLLIALAQAIHKRLGWILAICSIIAAILLWMLLIAAIAFIASI